jgi:hypothetical protein
MQSKHHNLQCRALHCFSAWLLANDSLALPGLKPLASEPLPKGAKFCISLLNTSKEYHANLHCNKFASTQVAAAIAWHGLLMGCF